MGKHSAKQHSLGAVRLAMLSATALVTAAVTTEHGPSHENRAIHTTTSWTDLETPWRSAAPITPGITTRPATTPAQMETLVENGESPAASDASDQHAGRHGIPLTYEEEPQQHAERPAETVADRTETQHTDRLSGNAGGHGKHAKKPDAEKKGEKKKDTPSAAPAAPDLGELLASFAQILNTGSAAGGSLAQALGSGSAALGTGSAAVAPVGDLLGTGSGSGSAVAGPLGALAKALGSGSAALGTGSSSLGKAGGSLASVFAPKPSGTTSKARHAAEAEDDTAVG
ncbi:hypothetical protein [Nocardia transvalensis]|uniref:hypothetical protein n=1 Tax=Nocardia transvalensis TaxID=37333 RepID=UPI00189397FD|nr:hypothetical protein [Nocardia transvalensis]MBF6331205.1 hypothetical protein [Nocardia transvalensis]